MSNAGNVAHFNSLGPFYRNCNGPKAAFSDHVLRPGFSDWVVPSDR